MVKREEPIDILLRIIPLLSALRHHGPLSTRELYNHTGYHLYEELKTAEEKGLIRRSVKRGSGVGKPAIVNEISKKGSRLLGVMETYII
ncbi:MAG: DNA-binding PadR family transcriptional regulator [Candidatus Nitrosomirales archaeon]|jgi:DNA-binding PadR family transcriptional regulator